MVHQSMSIRNCIRCSNAFHYAMQYAPFVTVWLLREKDIFKNDNGYSRFYKDVFFHLSPTRL
jgi:hypothetical protein